jgi:predicted 3-demethylubiquinone-9 3-methyltransferase (glyoxalase superfamily)
MRIAGQRITTFLMFSGKAGEAMKFYTSLFDDSAIHDIKKYGPMEAGAEGSVMRATFSLSGQRFMCIDSSARHGFTFTPAISRHVSCATEAEIDRLFENLSMGGRVLMPLAPYPFSPKYGWVADRFGVSWQLNLTLPASNAARTDALTP